MKVLFICAENTCRSQMAEGFARKLGIDSHSAGVKAGKGVNPDAVVVMSEVGIDISGQHSKAIDTMQLADYDAIISMCSVKTADICPAKFIGTQADWNIEDPWGQPIEVFRRVREEIKDNVDKLAEKRTR
jgi:arsenate reductase